MPGSPETWYALSCGSKYQFAFLCTANTDHLKGKLNLTRQYTRKELNLTSFEVTYTYKAASQQLLNSWQEKRVTGFQMNWYIQDQNGSRLTEARSEAEEWKEITATPMTTSRDSGRSSVMAMVDLARYARMENMTNKDITRKVLEEKVRLIEIGTIDVGECSGGQIQHDIMLFNKLYKSFVGKNFRAVSEDAIDDDVRNGFTIFATVVVCPEENFKISRFLQKLVSTESPRTILQSTVNTIQSGELTDWANRRVLRQFYQALSRVFDLQIGKIILVAGGDKP
jgi:hypothetical protein